MAPGHYENMAGKKVAFRHCLKEQCYFEATVVSFVIWHGRPKQAVGFGELFIPDMSLI